MSGTKQIVLILAVILLLPAAAAAQNRNRPDTSDRLWRGLEYLRQGTPLLVERTDGDWIKGRLITVSPGLLTLDRGRRLVEIQRGDVGKIWLFTGRKTGKGARVGSWIGAITGAVALGSICHDAGADKALCLFITLPFGGALGAGGGAGVGAVVGSTQRGRRLVYDSELSTTTAVIPRTSMPDSADSTLPPGSVCAPDEFQPAAAGRPCPPSNLEANRNRAVPGRTGLRRADCQEPITGAAPAINGVRASEDSTIRDRIPFRYYRDGNFNSSCWDGLRSVPGGAKIVVTTKYFERFRGRLIEVSDDFISLRRKKREIKFSREQVLRVHSQEKIHRLRNTLIGMGVGIGIGAGIGAVLDANRIPESGEAHLITQIFGYYGGLTGMGIGAGSPSHPTLYRARKESGENKTSRTRLELPATRHDYRFTDLELVPAYLTRRAVFPTRPHATETIHRNFPGNRRLSPRTLCMQYNDGKSESHPSYESGFAYGDSGTQSTLLGACEKQADSGRDWLTAGR